MPDDHHSHNNTSTVRLFVTMMLNFVITIAEVIGGIFSGSLSLISDALHNFSDGIAIIISYIAIRLNEHPKNEQYTFGLKRAEILAAIINSGVLIAICIYLFKEAYSRFINPEVISGGIMISVAGIGLAANIIGTLLLHKGAHSNMNIRSAYLHLLSDAFSSVGVIIGRASIYCFRIYWIDPLLTVLISLYVLLQSFNIVKEAMNILLMSTPAQISMDRIRKELESIPDVINIHHVHIWRLSEHDIHFEAHVDVEDMTVHESSRISSLIENKLLQNFNINHVTLQFECDRCESKSLV